MKFKRLAAAASLAAISLMAAPAMAAQTVTVGAMEGAACFPFVCNIEAESFDYFQIYSSEAFSGTISFDTITFFDAFEGILDPPVFLLGDFNIAFGVTEDPLGTIALPSVVDGFATFRQGALPTSGLSITGTAFTYDPSAGNLVMRVQASGASPADPNAFGALWSEITPNGVSRGGVVVGGPEAGVLTVENALVTQFSTAAVSGGAVPEPATWAMMILGFGATGALLRARRRGAVAAA